MGDGFRKGKGIMERIQKINKLLLITYNLGGICLMIIGAMVGVPGPPGYVPTGIKIITLFSAHILRYILKKRLERAG